MQIFNLRLDAAVTGFFMVLVVLIVFEAVRVWLRTLQTPESSSAALRTAEG